MVAGGAAAAASVWMASATAVGGFAASETTLIGDSASAVARGVPATGMADPAGSEGATTDSVPTAATAAAAAVGAMELVVDVIVPRGESDEKLEFKVARGEIGVEPEVATSWITCHHF